MDILLTFLLTFLLAAPLGLLIARLYASPASRFTAGLLRLCGVNAASGMNWRQYGAALLGTNAVLGVVAYLTLVTQGALPLNPDRIGDMRWDTALHTAASFITNTNQQHYSGQSGLSYLSQLIAIVTLQFVTPAAGMAALFAVLRGLRGQANVGNYYLDVTRALGTLLPASLLLAALLTSQGVPSTFSGAKTATLLQPQQVEGQAEPVTTQTIPVGPVAAMVAIKQLGTNGGGWYGPNSSVPLENPTPLSNLASMVSLILFPVSLVIASGVFLNRRRFGAALLGVMSVTSAALITGAVLAERQPNAALLGLAAPGGNMEGKEVRLGTDATALWASLTTQTSNGSVSGMHDSLNPLGGLVPQLGMFLNDVYGGIGVGMINMLVFVILTVFIAGLMVGRTPELFGRKIEVREIKLASLLILLQPALVLGFTAVTLAAPALSGTSNPGFHGLSQVLYEYNSAYANNGSGFEGLGDNTPWWNVTCAAVLILARFLPILAPLAIAGLLATKKAAPETSGTLRVDTPVFAGMLLGVMVLLQLLNFAPALVLGPVAEQLSLTQPAGAGTPAAAAPATVPAPGPDPVPATPPSPLTGAAR
ncbi:potassium-transporting ATPase potassium-binding subunit [Deinococcus seoulensis]|uniref:Potassium-transporting ATPase potassium-binding subunit n=1 Tax=Deinococcus seoulensis TaxID=1837379 RepID=A0ABQ2RV62_9DEIO|nr:potassium-transporting ATPase subunit KdpA [Deinococcus seoulensis]GGR58657.1 potassium-transporting ATPase potassium-binding subunit [Deinococcus seoulensis]